MELASTFLLLDAAAACRTAKTTLRLPAVVSAAAQAALLTVRMRARRAPGDPLIFHKTRVPSTARVKAHEDVPRHVYRLFKVLGIQFRWVLTRGAIARTLVSPAELAVDSAKETAWMAMYEQDRDTLEDILYRRLQDLWAPLTDAIKVFDTHGPAQPMCAQKVWEALLAAFPLNNKRMQTVLLAREIARMMRWDGDSKSAVNRHFASVTEVHRTMG